MKLLKLLILLKYNKKKNNDKQDQYRGQDHEIPDEGIINKPYNTLIKH